MSPPIPDREDTVQFIGAFESTYLPAHDVDVLEMSGHVHRWREDLELLRGHGVTRLRYPIRWHRVEERRGAYDWRRTDEVLAFLRDEGFAPIVDLVHHTSYPRWLEGSFADPRFGPAYLAFALAFAERYPWVEEYTLFNEPFATLFLCGHEAVWPPYLHGVEGFVALARNVLPAVAEASRRFRELLPGARHVWVDSCEGHTAPDGNEAGASFAAMANDRRHFAVDALLGRAVDRSRPFVAEVVAAGGADLLELEPGHLDVLGLDYYAHHEWQYRGRVRAVEVTREGRHPAGPGYPRVATVEGRTPAPDAQGLASLILQYAAHHPGLPLILAETNMLGATPDRATWLKHTLEQCERARAAGAPIGGYCWFGFLDSVDWSSLLARADRSIDPVGVIALDERLRRIESTMSRAYAAAARGASAAQLPAFHPSEELRGRIPGLLRLLDGFTWQDAPPGEVAHHGRGRLTALTLEEVATADGLTA